MASSIIPPPFDMTELGGYARDHRKASVIFSAQHYQGVHLLFSMATLDRCFMVPQCALRTTLQVAAL